MQSPVGGPLFWKKLPQRVSYCRGCLKQIRDGNITNTGSYMCAPFPAGSANEGLFDCYASTSASDPPYSASSTIAGFVLLLQYTMTNSNVCNENTFPGTVAVNYTIGCAYKC